MPHSLSFRCFTSAQSTRSTPVQRQKSGTTQSDPAAAMRNVEFGTTPGLSAPSWWPWKYFTHEQTLFAIGSLVPPRILHLFHYAENVIQRVVLGSIEKAQREEARCVGPTLGPTQGIHLLLSQRPAQICGKISHQLSWTKFVLIRRKHG